MTDVSQTDIHTAVPDDGSNLDTSSTDAHMPPQPGATDAPQNPIYAVPEWNPDTNEWAPSNEQHSTFGIAEPSHFDTPRADPMSDYEGQPEGADSAPDARMNLIDSVRAPRGPVAGPVVEHHHVIETEEVSAQKIRLRTVAVVGNTTATVIAEENPNRRRMLIQVFTAASTVLLSPMHQGGVPQLTAAVATPGAFWPLATADGRMEIKSGSGVEAVGITAAGVVLVAVLEELDAPGNYPGLG